MFDFVGNARGPVSRYGRQVPETKIERVLFALGLCVIAGLVTLIMIGSVGGGPARIHRAASVLKPRSTRAPRVATTSLLGSTTTAPGQPSTPTARPLGLTKTNARQSAPNVVAMTLIAALGDSWFEVRSGSATGRVLFSGTLPRGATRTFQGTRLWTSIGGGGNLRARLNGAALALPTGTYSAVITQAGLQKVPSP